MAVAQLIKFNILASTAVQRCNVALFWPTTYKGKSIEYFLQRFCLPGEKYHSFPLWPCLRVKRIAVLLPRIIGINTPGLLHYGGEAKTWKETWSRMTLFSWCVVSVQGLPLLEFFYLRKIFIMCLSYCIVEFIVTCSPMRSCFIAYMRAGTFSVLLSPYF